MDLELNQSTIQVSTDIWYIIFHLLNKYSFMNLGRVNRYLRQLRNIIIERTIPDNITFADVCRKGNDMHIIYLIDCRGDLVNWDQGLIGAASEGNINIVKSLVMNGATNFNEALITASVNDKVDVIKFLLELDINDIFIAINEACIYCSKAAVDVFINSGKFINFNDGLISACIGGSMEIVDIFINCGANNINDACLTLCTYGNDNFDIIVKLMAIGISNYETCFMECVYNDHQNLIVLFINYVRDIDINIALICACSEGLVDMSILLYHYGANNIDEGFFHACHHGMKGTASLMMNIGVSTYLCGFYNACSSNQNEIIKLLTKRQQIHANDFLQIACSLDNTYAIKKSIKAGARSINECLILACSLPILMSIKSIEILVDAAVDISDTLLMIVSETNDINIIRVFKERGHNFRKVLLKGRLLPDIEQYLRS